jgi:two-component system chemotaxis sensor kinase CheA
MSLDMDQFHEVYFAESFELLDAMEAALLHLAPGDTDIETVNTIFRVAHSIKGGAGMFGFNEIAAFTHTLETLLDELRSGRLPVTAPLCEGLLQSVDVIRAMLTAQQKRQSPDLAAAQLLQEQFRGMVVAPAPASAPPPVPSPAPQSERTPPRAVQPPLPSSAVARPAPAPVAWRIGFTALPGLLARGIDPLRLFTDLSGLGELTARADLSDMPALDVLDPAHCRIRWELTLVTTCPRSSIELIFDWAEGDCLLQVERADAAELAVAVPAAAAAVRGSAPAPVAASVEVNSIRVGIEKIDELLNVVGEVVITQSMLGQLARDLEGVHAERLRAGLTQLESNVRELQECVMRVRMLPVGSVFSRFPRLVRDLSTRLGKQIRLQLSGEQTELDKTVLEKIGDPLVHLVRNSIDHGIETPAERLAAGKPLEGVIHLNAFHKGGAINIVISDDGRGLHRDQLLERARARGLVDADEVLSDAEVQDLIFAPGFSTAAQATELSGRGVGMDVVRRNIKELGGSVELRSVAGEGTTLTITLPLTLAIVDGQSVQVGSETYIVPLVAIIESMQVQDSAVQLVHGHGEVFAFRGDYLPVIRLHEAFGVEPRSRRLADGLLMVVEGDGCRAGLFIDELLGQQQVVIKSMETNYARIPGVGGATILGEGSVALILDVPGLLRLAATRPAVALRTGT